MFNAQYGNRGCDANRQVKVPLAERSPYLIKCLKRAYDSAYDSDFLFSLGHKRSYDSAYDPDSDFVANENQP